jgi:hypothetical protein
VGALLVRPEFETFRAITSSWYTVPVLYAWNDLVAVGGLKGSEAEFEAVTE